VSVADYAEGEFFFDFAGHPACTDRPEWKGNRGNHQAGSKLELENRGVRAPAEEANQG
jgi:hypothetical protein